MIGFHEKHPSGSYLVRVGPECYKHGDPYTWCCNVVDEGEERCFVYGTERAPSNEERQWALKVAHDLGFRWIRWERRKGKRGKHTTQYFEISKTQ